MSEIKSLSDVKVINTIYGKQQLWCRGRVTVSHAEVPSSIPCIADRCQLSFMRNLCIYSFLLIILVQKASKGLVTVSADHRSPLNQPNDLSPLSTEKWKWGKHQLVDSDSYYNFIYYNFTSRLSQSIQSSGCSVEYNRRDVLSRI